MAILVQLEISEIQYLNQIKPEYHDCEDQKKYLIDLVGQLSFLIERE